jgi:hypothetical protein
VAKWTTAVPIAAVLLLAATWDAKPPGVVLAVVGLSSSSRSIPESAGRGIDRPAVRRASTTVRGVTFRVKRHKVCASGG